MTVTRGLYSRKLGKIFRKNLAKEVAWTARHGGKGDVVEILRF